MASTRHDIDEDTRAFVERQPMFFVGSAPLAASGRVNVSPKGLGTFRVFGPNLVGYLDMGGSGNETSAHILENGRVTLMFCAFEHEPLIVRLFGRGEVVVPSDPGWKEAYAKFPPMPGARQAIFVHVDRVATSCGYGVPIMRLEEQRDILPAKRRALGAGWHAHVHNVASIDGLPTHLARPRNPS